MIFNIWKFENKQPNEKVILLIRQHPFVMLGAAFRIIAIAIIIVLSFIFLGFSLITIVILIVGILVAIIIAASRAYLWYNDLYLLTDKRLINVEQINLFARSVDETALDLIQDVTYEVKGLLPTVLSLGRVAIQTAGSVQDIHIDAVPNPQAVQSSISKAFHEYREHLGYPRVSEENTPQPEPVKNIQENSLGVKNEQDIR